MPSSPQWPENIYCLALTDAVVGALRTVVSQGELMSLMEAIAREMGFRYYALIHHDDLRTPRPDRVDLKDYPAAISDRLIRQRRYRRDPVIRGCIFADSAFLWSDLPRIIHLDRQDRASFEIGAREGLNEGITVPYIRLGDRMGSCTFAGMRRPEGAHRYLGSAQMIGIFAFQAARRLVVGERADFVMLDRDPMLSPPSELRSMQVLETWTGGRKIYDAAATASQAISGPGQSLKVPPLKEPLGEPAPLLPPAPAVPPASR